MAASVIQIQTGSERENCYRFCRILIDIGNKIGQDYVKAVILYYGYTDINHFFKINYNKIVNHPVEFGVYNNRRELIKNKHLDEVIIKITNPQFNNTLDQFDISACTKIIRNMFARNSYYLGFFQHNPNRCLDFYENHNLNKLRDLRNKYYGHIASFKMANNDFRKAINELVPIFGGFRGNFSFITEINKVMKESLMEEDKMQKYL